VLRAIKQETGSSGPASRRVSPTAPALEQVTGDTLTHRGHRLVRQHDQMEVIDREHALNTQSVAASCGSFTILLTPRRAARSSGYRIGMQKNLARLINLSLLQCSAARIGLAARI
jgi:hypothetical protein